MLVLVWQITEQEYQQRGKLSARQSNGFEDDVRPLASKRESGQKNATLENASADRKRLRQNTIHSGGSLLAGEARDPQYESRVEPARRQFRQKHLVRNSVECLRSDQWVSPWLQSAANQERGKASRSLRERYEQNPHHQSLSNRSHSKTFSSTESRGDGKTAVGIRKISVSEDRNNN